MKENWLSQSTQDSDDSFYSQNPQEQCDCKTQLEEVEARLQYLDDQLFYNDCLIVEQGMGTAPSTEEEIHDWEMGKDSQPHVMVEQAKETDPLTEDEIDRDMAISSQTHVSESLEVVGTVTSNGNGCFDTKCNCSMKLSQLEARISKIEELFQEEIFISVQKKVEKEEQKKEEKKQLCNAVAALLVTFSVSLFLKVRAG